MKQHLAVSAIGGVVGLIAGLALINRGLGLIRSADEIEAKVKRW